MPDATDLASNLRLALRRLARSVFVVTARADGARFAMAATAVTELSMDPPSMLVCVNRGASLHRPLAGGADFCINVLHRDHAYISALCSGGAKGDARFGQGRWAPRDDLAPYLEDAQANLFCRNVRTFEHGTHGLFIGEVTHVRVQGEMDPLIYADGNYRVLAPAP